MISHALCLLLLQLSVLTAQLEDITITFDNVDISGARRPHALTFNCQDDPQAKAEKKEIPYEVGLPSLDFFLIGDCWDTEQAAG